MSDPIVVRAGGGRAFPGPTGKPMTVKLGADATRGAYSLIEYTHAPHTPGPPPHVHHEHEEAFHVTAGELTLDVDGDTLTLGPGDYAVVPRGAVHRPYNTSDAPVTFFFIASPAMDGFFAEMSDLNAATGGSPSPEQLREIGERWDSEFTQLPAATGVRMVNEE
ncbi:cupin domain-containing protein [Streptomyces parvus]|uniref:Cupin domain-containing protein n=1 Tax=Streptomyces parvus TaxID=66428 RepID=A0A7K3S339_9ACTN|nr:cupin domain-containing protein [Streptomyces parvus]